MSADNGTLVHTLTRDHKVINEIERIQKLGGVPQFKNGVWRVSGLAISRSFGDDKKGVNCEAEIKMFKCCSNYDFVVMCSDGVWDKMSSTEVVNKCWECVQKVGINKCCRMMAEGVMNEALRRESVDNVSVVCIGLQGLQEHLKKKEFSKFPRVL